jgi:hypothetical protein
METSKRPSRYASMLLSLFLLYTSLCLAPSARAQTIDYLRTRTLLQIKVHLRLGETTLSKTLQEMSRQTGLQIESADYLQERELLVDLDNMSAQAVLETLAEGNDWIWNETKQSRILMTRPKFNATRQLVEVAPAFRAIVPKDLRRYAGVDLTDAEIRSAFQQSQPNSELIEKPEKADFGSPRFRILPEILNAPVKEQERRMVAWVTAEVRTGKKIPYAQFTSEQQHSLLVRFVFAAMHTIFEIGHMGAANLVLGLDPAGVDEDQMRITVKDGGIFVGTLQGGRFSFGEGLMSEKQLPDPLLLHTPF